jgi:hypothetical protein
MGDHISGFIKESEVRIRCKNHVHPDVVRVLEDLAVQSRTTRSQMLDLAMMFDRMQKLMEDFIGVTNHMKSALDIIRKKDSTVSSEEIGDVNDAKRG